MDWSVFIPPLVGGVIGFITNDIAIRMLFHPRKALYVGKWRVPFTPGLIPKEKERVAKSLGNVISTQLLDVPTLKKNVFVGQDYLQNSTSLGSFGGAKPQEYKNNRRDHYGLCSQRNGQASICLC